MQSSRCYVNSSHLLAAVLFISIVLITLSQFCQQSQRRERLMVRSALPIWPSIRAKDSRVAQVPLTAADSPNTRGFSADSARFGPFWPA